MSSELSIEHLGILLVGHGTRDSAGCSEFLALAEKVARRSVFPAFACFLELAEPTIEAGVAQLASMGVRRILVVPVLLFSAGHAREDVPNAVAAAARSFGMSVVGQTEPLECHAKLLELSRLRYHEAETANLPSDTILLMVGRGGSVPSAIAEMESYASLYAQSLGLSVETSFMARAKPLFAEKLLELAVRKPPCVIVQPHLLFQGELASTIAHETEAMNASHPETRWIPVSHLGPHELVAEAIGEMIEQELR